MRQTNTYYRQTGYDSSTHDSDLFQPSSSVTQYQARQISGSSDRPLSTLFQPQPITELRPDTNASPFQNNPPTLRPSNKQPSSSASSSRAPYHPQSEGASIGLVHKPRNGGPLLYECDQLGCNGLRFARATDLRRHHDGKHEENKPEYFCPDVTCDRSYHNSNPFPRKDKMMEHARNMHEDFMKLYEAGAEREEEDEEDEEMIY
jgi:hypothetical protein